MSKKKTTTTANTTSYALKSNAGRAALSSGMKPGAFEIYEAPDGRYAWRPVGKAAAKKLAAQQVTAPTGTKKAAKPKPPAAPEPKPAPRTAKVGKRKAVLEIAAAGTLPAPPDFSKPTHERYRAKLEKLVELVKAGDVAGLKATEIKPISTSPKAMARYRDLAVLALQARQAA
jgi:hypothetical protein